MVSMNQDEAIAQAPKFEPAKTVKISAADRARFEAALADLDTAFGRPHNPVEPLGDPRYPDGWADAEIGRKALRWILKYDEFYDSKFVAMTDKTIAATRQRLKSIDRRLEPRPGFGTVKGYVSIVDGSVQPYAIYLPPDLDPQKPSPVLLVLHGRNQKLNEVSFFDAHEGKPYPKSELENGLKRIVVHVYGRTNNAYRWAGETDVIEVMSLIKFNTPQAAGAGSNFRVDPESIDLQGFSMGGAGAWHLGLHNPRDWRSVEAGAGFDETRNYARLKNVKPWEENLLTIYDSFMLARNVANVPTIGYGGENDPQLQASTNILDQLKREGFEPKVDGLLTTEDGLEFLRVVGAGQGHKVDPPSRAKMDAFVRRIAEKGDANRPNKIDQVTYTLKYPHIGRWVMLEGLGEHYRRAWFQGELEDGGKTARIARADNVTAFRITARGVETVCVGDQKFALDRNRRSAPVFVRQGDKWLLLDEGEAAKFRTKPRKKFWQQGPIDDAFTMGFLVVGPEGEGPAAQKRAMAEFASNWSKYLRGDLPVVSADRLKPDRAGASGFGMNRHLVLFGDSKSNPLIAKILPNLPQIRWTETNFTLGGKTYSTKDHYPALIAPNPLSPGQYVVINSGHTFGRKDFEGTNALLYPRLGDWGVMKIRDDGTTEIVDSGFFGEDWLPGK